MARTDNLIQRDRLPRIDEPPELSADQELTAPASDTPEPDEPDDEVPNVKSVIKSAVRAVDRVHEYVNEQLTALETRLSNLREHLAMGRRRAHEDIASFVELSSEALRAADSIKEAVDKLEKQTIGMSGGHNDQR